MSLHACVLCGDVFGLPCVRMARRFRDCWRARARVCVFVLCATYDVLRRVGCCGCLLCSQWLHRQRVRPIAFTGWLVGRLWFGSRHLYCARGVDGRHRRWVRTGRRTRACVAVVVFVSVTCTPHTQTLAALRDSGSLVVGCGEAFVFSAAACVGPEWHAYIQTKAPFANTDICCWSNTTA